MLPMDGMWDRTSVPYPASLVNQWMMEGSSVQDKRPSSPTIPRVPFPPQTPQSDLKPIACCHLEELHLVDNQQGIDMCNYTQVRLLPSCPALGLQSLTYGSCCCRGSTPVATFDGSQASGAKTMRRRGSGALPKLTTPSTSTLACWTVVEQPWS